MASQGKLLKDLGIDFFADPLVLFLVMLYILRQKHKIWFLKLKRVYYNTDLIVQQQTFGRLS
jgi:hypothetical protein